MLHHFLFCVTLNCVTFCQSIYLNTPARAVMECLIPGQGNCTHFVYGFLPPPGAPRAAAAMRARTTNLSILTRVSLPCCLEQKLK